MPPHGSAEDRLDGDGPVRITHLRDADLAADQHHLWLRAELAAKNEIIAAKDAVIVALGAERTALARAAERVERKVAELQATVNQLAASSTQSMGKAASTIERLEAKVLALGGSL